MHEFGALMLSQHIYIYNYTLICNGDWRSGGWETSIA